MAVTSIPAGTIAVGVDGSPASERAISWAVGQAAVEHRPLTLVHAVAPVTAGWLDQVGVDPLRGIDAMEEDGRALLGATRASVARRAPGLQVHDLVEVADPREVLLDVSETASVLVVGSRGRGPVRSLLLGSVGVAVTKHAHCPVVVVRPHHPGVVRQGVLVGIDGTERSVAPLDFAFRHASLHDLPLTVMHAYWDARGAAGTRRHADDLPGDLDEERLVVAEVISGMREKYPDVAVHTELMRGLPDVCLLQRAERMNLVVVGCSAGGTAAGLLFGSVSATVVEHATCPVAVVPVPPA